MTPLVSILIPAYNSENFIAETLRSALAQTWKRTEIIVVDDGSTDRTLEVARRFESAVVRVVSQQNRGSAAARNTAYGLSQGDYIQWLDADDLLAPDKISRQMAAAKGCISNLTLFSGAWGVFKYRPYQAIFTPTSLWTDLAPADWLRHKMAENVFIQTAAWLVSRELCKAAGPWDERLVVDDDGEYFCRVLRASDRVLFIADAKLFYRNLNTFSVSYIGNSEKKVAAQWLSMKMHIEYLRSMEESERVRAACLQYLHDSLFYFYPEHQEILAEAEELAHELGGKLQEPQHSRNYAAMEGLLGWRLAKWVQRRLRAAKGWSAQQWDWVMLRIEQCTGTRKDY